MSNKQEEALEASIQQCKQTIRQSLAIIHNLMLILQDRGFYLGICKIKLADLKFSHAEFYFNLSHLISSLFRVNHSLEFIKALDLLLNKKRKDNEFNAFVDYKPAFRIEGIYVLLSLMEVLAEVYSRFSVINSEASVEAVLRIDAKIRKLVFVPVFKEIDAIGQIEIQKPLAL
jgi:hypothetical protein